MTNTNYYILKPAVDTKETGRAYPAVESYDDYDFEGPNSVYKLKSGEFPDFTPDIRFRLAKGAKLCDMMGQATISGHGFLISEKLKIIFENANTAPCRFYPATIEDKGFINQYYWVHFVWEEGSNYINYFQSIFFIRRGLKNLGSIEIKSSSDYIAQNAKLEIVSYIEVEQLKLLNPILYDCFILNETMEIYINENFASKLNNSFITGIEIQNATKLH